MPSSDEESSSQVDEAHANGLLGDLIVGEDDELSTAESIEVNPFDGLPYSSMYYELLKKRQALPIWKAKDDFVLAVDDSPIVLITGRAGSGKSTQVIPETDSVLNEFSFVHVRELFLLYRPYAAWNNVNNHICDASTGSAMVRAICSRV